MSNSSNLRNKYLREPARLFITEGTTQGDPIAMGPHAVSLQPLITHLNLFSSARQCWFANDTSAAGTLEEHKIWWDELVTDGPQCNLVIFQMQRNDG